MTRNEARQLKEAKTNKKTGKSRKRSAPIEANDPNASADKIPRGESERILEGAEGERLPAENGAEAFEEEIPREMGEEFPAANDAPREKMHVDDGPVIDHDNPPVENDAENDPREYDELYASIGYAKDAEDSQSYAKKRNRDEYYWENEHENEIYAKRKRNGELEEFYAHTRNKKDILAQKMGVDGKKVEKYMMNSDGVEIYPDDESYKKYYVFVNDKPLFARDTYPEKGGKPYYASNKVEEQDVEFLPESDDGKKFYIELADGKVQIPFNLTMERPLYEKDGDGNEKYFEDADGNEYYAFHKAFRGKEFYARDKDGNEILAKKNDGIPFYTRKGENEEYPRYANGDQYYKKIDKKQIPAIRNRNFYYAKDKDYNEYYPAHDVKGQYYILITNTERVASYKDDKPFYARNDEQNEFYPKRYFE